MLNRIYPFTYKPHEDEAEKASNSYLMALIALMLGLPMPVINLIATAAFYLGNRKGSYFVRWHCTQALAAQFLFLFINSSGLYWTISILTGSRQLSNLYIAYMFTAILFNLVEFILTMYTAIKVRKGLHVDWWLFGTFANAVTKP